VRSLTAVMATALVLLPAAPAWAAGQAPVAVDDAVNIRSYAGVTYAVNALANDTDPDGDALAYTAVGSATKGRASLANGQLVYAAYLGNSGTDSFTYTVSDGQGNSATATVTATLWLDLPAPTGLAISNGSTSSATLSWPAATDAVQYQVFRNTVLVHTTSARTWTDTGLQADRQYEYRIAAVNGGGWGGEQSAAVYRQTQLPTPTDLAVNATTDATALTLTWSNGGPGPWNVYRDGALVTSSPTRSFTDTGLVTGREYGYQVQAAGSSSPTAISPPSALTAAVRGTPAVWVTPIQQLVRDRDLVTTLGPVTVPERAIPGGRQQDHQNGLILQQDGADPFVVGHSGFPTAYTGAGGATGELGFPLMDVECADLRAQGCIQLFEGGSIVRSSAHWAAVVVRLIIEDGWAASGWENGPLGWPAGKQMATTRGAYQLFEGGFVYWSETTGSHGVSGAHGFRDVWGLEGREVGRLGYPTSGEFCGLRADGCFQDFEGGTIHWSATTGAQITTGAIQEAWARSGWEDGFLGYPTSGQVCGLRNGGCGQAFQGGSIHWSPATGAQITSGGIRNAWASQGWENGYLGYPLTGTVCGLRNGGCGQAFQGGSIHWSPATGAQITSGGIRTAWASQGWENGYLGYPTTGTICGLRNGGCGQAFQGGSIHWSPATGAQITSGAIRDAWARQGWESGRLGYPTAGETVSGGVARQTFQGGSITVDLRTGRVTVR
jgi:uncharacterized protein with LGFP repeats